MSSKSPLSKQILNIIDLKLPEDTTIFEIILEAMGEKKLTDTRDISNKAFKQILATFQSAKLQLDEYARFQNLVDEFLNVSCLDTIEKKHSGEKDYSEFIYPKKLLDSHILWLTAPEYPIQDKAHSLYYKLGNFLGHYTDEFFTFIEKYKEKFAQKSLLVKSRSLLEKKEEKITLLRRDFLFSLIRFNFSSSSSKCLSS